MHRAALLLSATAGVTDAPGLRPRPVKRVAVLGGGLMGSGIATACVLAGIEVVLKEINQKFLDVSEAAGGGGGRAGGVGSVEGELAGAACREKTAEELVQGARFGAIPQHAPSCCCCCLRCPALLLLQGGLGRIQSNLASRVKKGRMSEAAAQAAMARVQVRAGGAAVKKVARCMPSTLMFPFTFALHPCAAAHPPTRPPPHPLQGALDYSSFGSVEMVIEAAIEDIKLKQEIFAELQRVCRADAILATNTSTISIDLVAAKTTCPGERAVGGVQWSVGGWDARVAAWRAGAGEARVSACRAASGRAWPALAHSLSVRLPALTAPPLLNSHPRRPRGGRALLQPCPRDAAAGDCAYRAHVQAGACALRGNLLLLLPPPTSLSHHTWPALPSTALAPAPLLLLPARSFSTRSSLAARSARRRWWWGTAPASRSTACSSPTPRLPACWSTWAWTRTASTAPSRAGACRWGRSGAAPPRPPAKPSCPPPPVCSVLQSRTLRAARSQSHLDLLLADSGCCCCPLPAARCLPAADRLSDLVGADIGLHVGKNIIDSFPDRVYPARIILLLNEAKRLGEKSGAGFYKYDARRRAAPDPTLAPLVQQSRQVGWGGGWGGGKRGGQGRGGAGKEWMSLHVWV